MSPPRAGGQGYVHVTKSKPLAGRVVAASCRRPWLVLLVAFALGAAALLHTMRNFAMTTDTTELISPELDWRRQRAAFSAAFPQFTDSILVVIDAATPEQAEAAATMLAARLQERVSHLALLGSPVGALLRGGGTILAEVDPPGGPTGRLRARLEGPDLVSRWFAWATVSADGIESIADAAGMRVRESFSHGERWFVEVQA